MGKEINLHSHSMSDSVLSTKELDETLKFQNTNDRKKWKTKYAQRNKHPFKIFLIYKIIFDG